MSNGYHQQEVSIPIKSVWSFISDMEEWAPLVPGHVAHERLNSKQSIWEFRGDIGFIQRTVRLQVDITQLQEPEQISFRITGLNENITGNGYFKAEKLLGSNTQITGYLHMTAQGMVGRMINPILKSRLPKATKQLTEAVAEKMNEREVMLT